MILPKKAIELSEKLGLNYIPSAFQIRYGQNKGLLLVFPYDEYLNKKMPDINFTQSMWKEDFDITQAEFLVGNISKPPKKYCEWNYQMMLCLNKQLTFDDIRPYIEQIKEYMDRAMTSPENALEFLGLLDDYELENIEATRNDNLLSSVTKLSAVIQANPKLSMNLRWVRKIIKKRIDLLHNLFLMDSLAFFTRKVWWRMHNRSNYYELPQQSMQKNKP